MTETILFSVFPPTPDRPAFVDYAPASAGEPENVDRFFDEVIALSCKALHIDATKILTIREHKKYEEEELQVVTTVDKLYDRVRKVIDGVASMSEMFPNSVR